MNIKIMPWRKIWPAIIMTALCVAIIVMFMTNRNMEPNFGILVGEMAAIISLTVSGIVAILKNGN